MPAPLTGSLPPRRAVAPGDAIAALRLIRSRRVGAVTFHRLVAEEGSIAAALSALPDIAAQAGVPGYHPCPEAVALAEWQAGQRRGAHLLLYGDPHYPSALMDLPDAPPILWAEGRLDLLDRPRIAIVGARNASSLGLRMAGRLAADLGAAGHVITSGLARGIDAAAHEAALPSGTVAVLAGGLDIPYPEDNARLQARIAEAGCLLAEQPFGLEPQARHFPQRNRIISGLSRAVVVVEAAERSGSLSTARDALDQGREVLAVPGHPMDQRSGGCLQLIRDGATLVRNAEDVLAALAASPCADPSPPAHARVAPAAYAPATRPAAAPPQTAPQGPSPNGRSRAQIQALHQQILNRLGPSPLAEDQLLRDLGLTSASLASAVLELELEGQVERHPGAMISRLC